MILDSRVRIALCALLLVGGHLSVAAASAQAKRPDLVVVATKQPAVVSVQAGGRSMLQVSIRNSGAGSAKRSRAGVFLSADRRRSRGDRRLTPTAATKRLRAGSRVRLRIAAQLPATVATGRYFAVACADARRSVRERRERNNCAAVGELQLTAADTAPPPADPGPAAPAPGPDTDHDGVSNEADPDVDGDGIANAHDCGPEDPKVFPGATDVPDSSATDADCDGIDGHPVPGKDVFVSPMGADGDPGTREQPKRSLGSALTAAYDRGGDVYAAVGDYASPPAGLMSQTDIYGGYDPVTWTRRSDVDPGTPATSIHGSGDGLLAKNAQGVTLQLLRVGAFAVVAKPNAYGIRALEGSKLTLDTVEITAGAGLSGATGAAGTKGANGLNGGNGIPGLCDDGYDVTFSSAWPKQYLSWSGGGLWGAPPGAGGGYTHALINLYGTGAPGQGGDGGAVGFPQSGKGMPGAGSDKPGGLAASVPGQSGGAGPDGHVGTGGWPGNGGLANVTLAGTTWAAPAATDGTGGFDGRGGSGGGGGASPNVDSSGSGGGGGGTGGKGGSGGKAGTNGSGSFGLYLHGASSATLKGKTRIITGKGGNGGKGGAAGPGGAGGQGGNGGVLTGCGNSFGGPGGDGGTGGAGGAGGGGAGGPSIGIMLVAGSTATGYDTGLMTLGEAGAGGDSPAGGLPYDGATGLRAYAKVNG